MFINIAWLLVVMEMMLLAPGQDYFVPMAYNSPTYRRVKKIRGPIPNLFCDKPEQSVFPTSLTSNENEQPTLKFTLCSDYWNIMVKWKFYSPNMNMQEATGKKTGLNTIIYWSKHSYILQLPKLSADMCGSKVYIEIFQVYNKQYIFLTSYGKLRRTHVKETKIYVNFKPGVIKNHINYQRNETCNLVQWEGVDTGLCATTYHIQSKWKQYQNMTVERATLFNTTALKQRFTGYRNSRRGIHFSKCLDANIPSSASLKIWVIVFNNNGNATEVTKRMYFGKGEPLLCGNQIPSSLTFYEFQTPTISVTLCGYPAPVVTWKFFSHNVLTAVRIANKNTYISNYFIKLPKLNRSMCGSKIHYKIIDTNYVGDIVVNIKFKPGIIKNHINYQRNKTCNLVQWEGIDTGRCAVAYIIQSEWTPIKTIMVEHNKTDAYYDEINLKKKHFSKCLDSKIPWPSLKIWAIVENSQGAVVDVLQSIGFGKNSSVICGSSIPSSLTFNEFDRPTIKITLCGDPTPVVTWKFLSSESLNAVRILNKNNYISNYLLPLPKLNRSICGAKINFKISGTNYVGEIAVNIKFAPSTLQNHINFQRNKSCNLVQWEGMVTGRCSVTYYLVSIWKLQNSNTIVQSVTVNGNALEKIHYSICLKPYVPSLTNLTLWASVLKNHGFALDIVKSMHFGKDEPFVCGNPIPPSLTFNEFDAPTINLTLCGYPTPKLIWNFFSQNNATAIILSGKNSYVNNYLMILPRLHRKMCGAELTYEIVGYNYVGKIIINVKFIPNQVENVSFQLVSKNILIRWNSDYIGNCIMEYSMEYLNVTHHIVASFNDVMKHPDFRVNRVGVNDNMTSSSLRTNVIYRNTSIVRLWGSHFNISGNATNAILTVVKDKQATYTISIYLTQVIGFGGILVILSLISSLIVLKPKTKTKTQTLYEIYTSIDNINLVVQKK